MFSSYSKAPGHGHCNNVQLFNLCTRIYADSPVGSLSV